MSYIPLLACIAIGVALIYGGYTDYKSRIIPNRVPVSILLLGVFTATPVLTKLASLVAIIVILVLLRVIGAQKSGGGDIKVYCSLAFALGMQMMALILIATIVLALLWSLVAKRCWPQKKERIPLCTFLAPAYIIVFAGAQILGVFV